MKKKVCCFCEQWKSGGIESFLHGLLLSIDTSKYEIDIVAADIEKSIFTSDMEKIGVHFEELSGKLRSPKNYMLFRRLLRRRRYDVIHFNLFQGLSLYYIQIAKEEGVPKRIAHAHGAGLRNSLMKPIKMVLHSIGRKLWVGAATDYWACSRDAARFLFPSFFETVHVIPNGIDAEKFRFSKEKRETIRTELKLRENYVVGNVGRLSSEKNQFFLLYVLAELIKERPTSRLLLVGDGEEKTKLRKTAKRLGISEYVIFYGWSGRVEFLLSAMDVFAFPSRKEGFGISCIEAQASGLSVVCSPGIPEEVRSSPCVRTVPLSAGVQVWAKALLESSIPEQRECAADRMKKTPFTLNRMAEWIEAEYADTENAGKKERFLITDLRMEKEK